MRRPALVAAAAMSAVLAGGIMVATSADAEETPDTPAVPSIQWPGLPTMPQLPGLDDVANAPVVPIVPGDDDAQDEPDGQGKPVGGVIPARPGGVARPAATAAIDGSDDDSADGDDSAEPVPDADDPAARPAIDDDKRNKVNRADRPAAAHRDVTDSQALSPDPLSPVQQQALDLVNQNRRRSGCDEVTVDRRLILAANRHAADMARRGYFAHEDTRGERAGDRVEDAGYRWSRYGENIARGQESVFEVVDGWMHSPEHRENILDCKLHQVGLGLAFAGDRTAYWVQDFATPQ
ncbi:CAP domain-containing protein [Actinoplanes sp. NPDC026623]|uniref:CAP domain-containing protein n=1 Tax=Actinoplanes sp. NPDC026623 TaxID=3155610 RepID=UPI003401E663